MLNFLLHLRSAVSLTLMLSNTVFWCVFLFIVAIFKFAIPLTRWRNFCYRVLITIAEAFIDVNSWILKNISRAKVQITEKGIFDATKSYLVVSNHQSYADIILLQRTLNHKIPFLKFFLKQQLIWIPVFGLAWWALDFPFMKRHSREYLRKHPEKAGSDFEATKRACEKFKHHPVSIMNFAEGTRFTLEKHQRQDSPFKNLLRPKAGGIGYVLSLLGDQIQQLVNVTIKYSENDTSLWSFLGGRHSRIEIIVEVHKLAEDIKGDYINQPESRVKVQRWLNEIWKIKDQQLSE